jgi:hypothetical protein
LVVTDDLAVRYEFVIRTDDVLAELRFRYHISEIQP